MTTVDFYDKDQADTLLNGKADKTDTYTKTETNTLLGAKANASDVYTKSEANTLLGAKANASDVYTKSETDNAIVNNQAVRVALSTNVSIPASTEYNAIELEIPEDGYYLIVGNLITNVAFQGGYTVIGFHKSGENAIWYQSNYQGENDQSRSSASLCGALSQGDKIYLNTYQRNPNNVTIGCTAQLYITRLGAI